MIDLNILNWILALAPVLTVLVLMVGFGMGGSRAGLVALAVALVLAVARFGAGPLLLSVAVAKSVLLALDVLLIVWMALFFYNVTKEAGTVEVVGTNLKRLTSDPALQSLLLAWVFVSLLQGVGGFGVPVAVVAPLMVGLGYTATQSVIMASLGHGWAVTFGSLGTSFVALTAVTNLGGEVFASEAAIMLGLAGVLSGALVVYVSSGWPGLLRSVPILLVIGAVMGLTQWFVATRGLWTLGATSGALAGAVVFVGILVSPIYSGTSADDLQSEDEAGAPSLRMALAAYVILLVIAFSINLIPQLEALFDLVQIRINFPAVATSLGWETPAEAGRVISVFGHPGAILFYAGILSFWLYKRAGYFEEGAFGKIWGSVRKSAVKSTISILALVATAVIMSHAGMTQLIARGISETFSAAVYPLFTPFIGTLGAFITGSNTNSNVLFGDLQRETAQLLGLSIPIILAGQTAGASLGSVLAPAKIIVGCSTVGLTGQEGPVIRQMILLGLIPVVFVALLTWGLAAAM
ncbi:MAG: L-lactate permease [Chloroflexota bacterium]